MARIVPFKALRFTEKAGPIEQLCCPPYDIISKEEQDKFYKVSPYNIIRLELSKEENPYVSAAETLKGWLKEGILKTDDEDSLYLYEEEFLLPGEASKKIRVLIARVELSEFSKGVVLPHEETLSKAKEDRLCLMSSTFCNFSQIYSMYMDDDKKIKNNLDKAALNKPDIEFTFIDGVIQRLWIITDKSLISSVVNDFSDKKLYIADGHHRYETALNFKKKLINENKLSETNNDHAANFCMMALCDIDDPGLVVFPTHRLIRGIEGFDKEKVRQKLACDFDVTTVNTVKEAEKILLDNRDGKCFLMYTGSGEFFVFKLKNPDSIKKALPNKCDAYRDLDVAVLHSIILEPVFGIDGQNMANQINLSYTRSFEEAISKVDSKECQCAFIINPTKVRQIKDVAAAFEKMPQKSTYFYPKLVTGIVMNRICDIL